MTVSDRELIKSAQKGQFSSMANASDMPAAVAMLHRRHVCVTYTDQANVDLSIPIMRTDRAIRIVSVRIATGAAVVADNTNYKTLVLNSGDDANGSPTALTNTISTTVAGLGFSALTSRAFTPVAAAAELASGRLVYLTTTTPGSGVDMGMVVVDVVYEEI